LSYGLLPPVFFSGSGIFLVTWAEFTIFREYIMCLNRIVKFRPVRFGYVVVTVRTEKSFWAIYRREHNSVYGYRLGKWHVAKKTPWQFEPLQGFHIFHKKGDAIYFMNNLPWFKRHTARIVYVEGEGVLRTGIQLLSLKSGVQAKAKVTCVRRRKILRVVKHNG